MSFWKSIPPNSLISWYFIYTGQLGGMKYDAMSSQPGIGKGTVSVLLKEISKPVIGVSSDAITFLTTKNSV